MQIAETVHLFYCLNVYPANTSDELEEAVFSRARRVLEAAGLAERCAVGMWLNNSLINKFDPYTFHNKLSQNNLYCYSLNGFPFGCFHGQSIKQKVYLPDWASPCRIEYTKNLAGVLSRLIPNDETGTISTLPIGYRNSVTSATLKYAVENLRSCARFLNGIYQETGKKVVLALEPEPDCFLDDSSDAARWLEEVLFNDHHEEMLREFIGVCLDTVHSSVLFEKPLDTLNNFVDRGIKVRKIQLGSAISFDSAQAKAQTEISRYSDEVYLHQVRVNASDHIISYPDLPHALADNPSGEWRVHYHVPLSWSGANGLQGTSGDVDAEFINKALKVGVKHFEVEIYTLDVFPDKRLTAQEILVNELQYAHQLITQGIK